MYLRVYVYAYVYESQNMTLMSDRMHYYPHPRQSPPLTVNIKNDRHSLVARLWDNVFRFETYNHLWWNFATDVFIALEGKLRCDDDAFLAWDCHVAAMDIASTTSRTPGWRNRSRNRRLSTWRNRRLCVCTYGHGWLWRWRWTLQVVFCANREYWRKK